MFGGDEVAAIVLDLGSHTVKGGYAGEDAPKAVLPSVVGGVWDDVAKGGKDVAMTDADAKRKRTYYVNQMGYRRDHMEVVSPFGKDGLIEDWDVVEQLWDHTLHKALLVDPKEHPMLLAEPPHVTRAHREKAVQLMFETQNVPALFLGKNPVLTAFASGKATSLVVDLGGQGTTITAVHDGYALTKSTMRTPLGGELLSEVMLHSVEASGATVKPRYAFKRKSVGADKWDVTDVACANTTASYTRWARHDIAADIMHSLGRVSDSKYTDAEMGHIPTVTYELPDGNNIEVGADRFKVPELLFQPELLPTFTGFSSSLLAGADVPAKGLHGMVLDVIGRCDVDVRKDLYGGVLMTGGVAQIPNMRERLERELSEQVSSYAPRVKVGMPNPLVERRFSVFIGGSILASLGSFQQMWLSKAEYDEHGPSLIHRKCP